MKPLPSNMQAVRNIREVRGFGAEARELARFQAASQGAADTSVKLGAAGGRLEALNRAAIYFRCAVAELWRGGNYCCRDRDRRGRG